MRIFSYEAVTKARIPKTKVRNGKARTAKMTALNRRAAGAVTADLSKGLKTFKKRISKKALMKAWEAGDYDNLDRHIPWDKLPGDLSPIDRTMSKSLLSASLIGFEALPPPAKHMRWDLKNPRIRGEIDKRTGNLIEGIKSTTRNHVRMMVARSFTHALTPRQVANEIVGSIGLNKRYVKALENYRSTLEKAGKSEAFIEEHVGRYEERLLKARSMTVARTEVRQANARGQREVWKEAAAQGYIDGKTAKRTWVIGTEACEICEPLDGQETTIDGTYYTDEGEAVEPTEVHPNCDCDETLEME